MSVPSMPCLRDCPCGGQVVLEVDHDGAVEVCYRCGAAHPAGPAFSREEIRRRVRVVYAKALRGEL